MLKLGSRPGLRNALYIASAASAVTIATLSLTAWATYRAVITRARAADPTESLTDASIAFSRINSSTAHGELPPNHPPLEQAVTKSSTTIASTPLPLAPAFSIANTSVAAIHTVNNTSAQLKMNADDSITESISAERHPLPVPKRPPGPDWATFTQTVHIHDVDRIFSMGEHERLRADGKTEIVIQMGVGMRTFVLDRVQVTKGDWMEFLSYLPKGSLPWTQQGNTVSMPVRGVPQTDCETSTPQNVLGFAHGEKDGVTHLKIMLEHITVKDTDCGHASLQTTLPHLETALAQIPPLDLDTYPETVTISLPITGTRAIGFPLEIEECMLVLVEQPPDPQMVLIEIQQHVQQTLRLLPFPEILTSAPKGLEYSQ